MKYVKTFEGWFKKLKPSKEVVNSTAEDEEDRKEKEFNKKIDEALSEIHIHGLNFIIQENSNPRKNTRNHGRIQPIKYISEVDLEVPIEGYIDTKIQVRKSDFERRDYDNELKLMILMSFDPNSTVANISDDKFHGEYSFNKNVIQDKCTISRNEFDLINYASSVEDIREKLISMINKLINIDFKEIQKNIDKLEEERIKKKRIEDEYISKLLNLKSKLDDISDYLIDLEEMSTEYNKEFKDGKIILTYDIPGINVGKSDNDTAKLIINNVILNVMSIIKTFTKRAEKEIEGVIVKSNFSINKIIIKLSIPPMEYNDPYIQPIRPRNNRRVARFRTLPTNIN